MRPAGVRAAFAEMSGMKAAGFALAALLALSACGAPSTAPSTPAPLPNLPLAPVADPVSARDAARNFVSVAARMKPLIEAECRARTRGVNCNYLILVDEQPGRPPNAYQTLDSAGRPVVAMNTALIAEARNVDELAFVLGHEAAHHIAGHIPRARQTATAGAFILGTLAAASGGDESMVRSAQDFGATMGIRAYSKEFELEADRLGTILSWRSGYDPERGALFFNRLADPGNRFLGTHPANAERLEVVRRTVAELRAGLH